MCVSVGCNMILGDFMHSRMYTSRARLPEAIGMVNLTAP